MVNRVNFVLTPDKNKRFARQSLSIRETRRQGRQDGIRKSNTIVAHNYGSIHV